MNDYLFAISSACTLVTLNYIALKIRTRVEAIEYLAVPLLTGLASIIMMLEPLPSSLMTLDFRFAPIVMAGLRFGFGLSILSALLPGAYILFSHQPDWIFGMTNGLLIPAIVSSLLHKKDYRTGYVCLKIRDGLLICAVLFVLRSFLDYLMHRPELNSDWLLNNLAMLLASGIAILALMAMFNDESTSWLAQRQLELQANQDGLTKLPNLRSFMEIAHNTIRKQRISILMIDIDNFKKYNDRFGHLQGDRLLREIGQMLRNLIRDQDYVARYGGEEFIVMCLTNDVRQLQQIATRLCVTIASHAFDGHPTGQEDRISISIGIAVAQRAADDLMKLIAEADSALYESKNTGKNKFTFFQDNDEPAQANA